MSTFLKYNEFINEKFKWWLMIDWAYKRIKKFDPNITKEQMHALRIPNNTWGILIYKHEPLYQRWNKITSSGKYKIPIINGIPTTDENKWKSAIEALKNDILSDQKFSTEIFHLLVTLDPTLLKTKVYSDLIDAKKYNTKTVLMNLFKRIKDKFVEPEKIPEIIIDIIKKQIGL